MTRCESYPPCFGTIYFPTAPFFIPKFQIGVMKWCLLELFSKIIGA